MTLPLFDPPTPDPVRHPQVTPKPGRPTWSRYRPKNPVKCDDCMAVHAETGGRGPIAGMARWRRAVGRDYRLLCYAHARRWRDHDKLPALKGGA